MSKSIKCFLIPFFIIYLGLNPSIAQKTIGNSGNRSGWFSLGIRNTLNTFSQDGTGLGTGGQFRLQLSNRVNTGWFADYITINSDDQVRSEYYHIGWSVMFYPFLEKGAIKSVEPYIAAGHCFDYNRKTVIAEPTKSLDRWSSAVQAGLGTHFHLTDRFEVSLTGQYMTHLTREIEVYTEGNEVSLHKHKSSALEGHFLATLSLNYKILRLW